MSLEETNNGEINLGLIRYLKSFKNAVLDNGMISMTTQSPLSKGCCVYGSRPQTKATECYLYIKQSISNSKSKPSFVEIVCSCAVPL